MAKLKSTEEDLLHRWCNRDATLFPPESDGRPASQTWIRVGHLSTQRNGKTLTYDGSVVGLHLDVGGTLITLYADYIEASSSGWGNAKSRPMWVVYEIPKAMPSGDHHAVKVNHNVLGAYGPQPWIVDDDTQILRNLGYRSLGHWGNAGRDDTKLAAMKAHRHGAMQNYNDGCKARIDSLCTLRTLTNGAVPELQVYERVLAGTLFAEGELDTARTYSTKWQDIDEARVQKHGAFGRVSWEEQQRRNAQRRKAREEKEAKEREYWTDEKIAELIADWKSGGGVHGRDFPYWVSQKFNEVTHLRIKGNGVETSRGVWVGIREAAKLLRLCDRVWGMELPDGVPGPQPGLQFAYNAGPKVGLYQLRSIDMTKVVVGCHTLLRSTIEEFKPRFLEAVERLKIDMNKEGEEGSPLLQCRKCQQMVTALSYGVCIPCEQGLAV